MYKIKIHHTLYNGSQTISNLRFVIFHLKDLKCLLHLLVIQQQFNKCLKELLNNLLLCSEEKPSYTGIQVKVWTRWNSLKLNQIWMTWFHNINNTKMRQLNKKDSLMNRKLHDCLYRLFLMFVYKFFYIKLEVYIIKHYYSIFFTFSSFLIIYYLFFPNFRHIHS
jgi:hypothetical protein